jgi:hypothetical protein
VEDFWKLEHRLHVRWLYFIIVVLASEAECRSVKGSVIMFEVYFPNIWTVLSGGTVPVCLPSL